MCLCSYHANFIEAIEALQKCIPDMPGYKNGFIQKFLCDNSTKSCWFGECRDCHGISVDNLRDCYGDTRLDSKASWIVWEKNDVAKRTEKKKKSGTLMDLTAHISAISTQFLRHSFCKRQQSDTFNKSDVPMAKNVELTDTALLQVDFAENFVCVSQKEVQNAHWNQKQLSLFTSALYHNNEIHSKVFVSDNTTHTKETIIPFMYKLLTDLPKTVKVLKVWSDGPSSQFKNKFMAAILSQFEREFGLKIYWNFFATSHGKGCIDGIGATVKSIVRTQIKAKDHIVNSAADFVAAFHLAQSKINVEEVTDADFEEINSSLGVDDIFSRAKAVRDIASAHQIQVIGDKIVTFHTSKEGYD